MADDYWITARFGSQCAECEEYVFEGERVGWRPRQRAVLCPTCAESIIGPDPAKRRPADDVEALFWG